ncbi:hypothetical protein DB354_15660 [Opitutus sp. ER46]|nr:hypothetical protein DB354_15660 [Opitutus sp. ER46]
MDFAPFQQRAGALFDPGAATAKESPLRVACGHVLLLAQAGSVCLIVAGLISRMRRDDAQMESIAGTMLKVAFIATVAQWRALAWETADLAAGAIGYQPAVVEGRPSPLLAASWKLLEQWAPPGSPYLDTLEASATPAPASGQEQEWSLRAWNWARGMGAATTNVADGTWQAASGGLRAAAVFVCCGAMSILVALTLLLALSAELVRVLCFEIGCAVLPIGIAGLGIELLRGASLKFLLRLVVVAAWPLGWALAALVTLPLVEGGTAWMREISAAALGEQGAAPSSLAVAAPYLGWGTVFFCVAMTVALCLWLALTVVGMPLLLSRGAVAGFAAVHGSSAREVATARIVEGAAVLPQLMASESETRCAVGRERPAGSGLESRGSLVSVESVQASRRTSTPAAEPEPARRDRTDFFPPRRHGAS